MLMQAAINGTGKAIPPMVEKGVLTIALGKKYYLDLACNLARSFKVWHKHSKLKFCIATDRAHELPDDLGDIHIVSVPSDKYGRGFETKLYLDEITPYEKTLFIDADCLCTGNLEKVLDSLDGYPFTAVGRMVSEGDFFGDVSARCKKNGVSQVPFFVGALYYFERGPKSSAVFGHARKIKESYDESGFVRLANLPNEEPLLSLGMAIERLPVFEDTTEVKADAMYFDKRIDISVLNGHCEMERGSNVLSMTPFASEVEIARPLVAHFNSSYAESGEYKQQALALKLRQAYGFPVSVSNGITFVVCLLPYRLKRHAKNTLRPLYRMLFGYRRAKQSKRETG